MPYLLMYSALSTLLHTLHLKQPRCQCLSSATRDCSFLNSFPQPQQSDHKTSEMEEKSAAVGSEKQPRASVCRKCEMT